MALVITGAKAFIRISGEVLAFASGVSVTHENRLEEIPELDRLEVAEYAENGHRCSISITSLKLAADAGVSNSGHDFNLDFDVNKHKYQKVGAAAGGLFTPTKDTPQNFKKLDSGDINQILLQPEMIIEIVEDVGSSEATIYIGYGAKFEGGTGQLDARGIWQGNWNFKCRRGVGI